MARSNGTPSREPIVATSGHRYHFPLRPHRWQYITVSWDSCVHSVGTTSPRLTTGFLRPGLHPTILPNSKHRGRHTAGPQKCGMQAPEIRAAVPTMQRKTSGMREAESTGRMSISNRGGSGGRVKRGDLRPGTEKLSDTKFSSLHPTLS